MASLFVYLPKNTLEYLKGTIPSIDEHSIGVAQDELDKIEYLNFKYIDVMYLQYFRNLKTLVIEGFPGISDRNFDYLARNCSKLTTLVIKGQPLLTKIDLTRFKELRNLSIISNERLVKVVGLEEGSSFINQLDKVEFYDNIGYKKEKELVRRLVNSRKKRVVELDALYYVDAKNEEGFSDVSSNFEWHEKIAYNSQRDLTYSSGEMEAVYQYANSIVDTIIKPSDSEEMKVFVIYTWVLKNIKLDSNRDVNTNEGIVNVFKYRTASIPTIAKFLQFLLRVAGIISYDVNVAPRVRFYNSPLGVFKIPSDDYEIIKVPTKDGYAYFDIAWDCDIYSQTGRLSTIFMYNGLEDITYNHKLRFDSLDGSRSSMPFEEREDYSKKASKRLQNVKNHKGSNDGKDIVESVVTSHDFMQKSMDNFLKSIRKMEEKRKSLIEKLGSGKETARTRANIKNLDMMIEAAENSNRILRENIYKYESLLSERLVKDDISFLENRLGSTLSPFKSKKFGDDKYVKVTKTKEELEQELKRLKSKLNKELANKEINITEYRSLMDRVNNIYTYLVTFAYEKSIIIDSKAAA